MHNEQREPSHLSPPQAAQMEAGQALIDMQGVNTLDDVAVLRAVPSLLPETRQLLDTSLDDLVCKYTTPKSRALLGAANQFVAANARQGFYYARHAYALGYEGMAAVDGMTQRRARLLGTFISRHCMLPVPAQPSPEFFAYISDDFEDMPAFLITTRDRVRISQGPLRDSATSRADDKVTSKEFNDYNAGRFEQRFWLARAIMQANQDGQLFQEIGA